MPEGPEIKRAAEKVAKILQGQTLRRVQVYLPQLEGCESRWTGLEVVSVSARGKALLTHFSNQDILYSHNQLYGRWLTRKDHETPTSNRSLRVSFFTDKGSAYLYSATDVEVLRPESLVEHVYLSKLGPDVLNLSFTTRSLSTRLRSKTFWNRQLASLYLDQSFLAGPGNYLRSEILFCAGLHPRLRPSQLSAEQIRKLSRCTLDISRRAYSLAGVTTEPSLFKRLKASGLTRRLSRHYVFGREGKLCRVCEDDFVIRTTISNRSVFFCPTCQAGSPITEMNP